MLDQCMVHHCEFVKFQNDGGRQGRPPVLEEESIMVAICAVNRAHPEESMLPHRTTVNLLGGNNNTVMGTYYGYYERNVRHNDIHVRVYIPRSAAEANMRANNGEIDIIIDLKPIIREVAE